MKRGFLALFLIVLIISIFIISKSFTSAAAITVVNVGKIGDYPSGTIKFISKAKAFIISDNEGIYAVSAVCTHLGCSLNNKDNKFACPCHGANFDLTGKVLSGPAKMDLSWYLLEIDKDKNLILDTSAIVSKGSKLLRSQK